MHAERGIKDFRTTPYIIACAVVVKRLLQKRTLLLMIIKIILIPNDPVKLRYDNWIAVSVLLLQALRQAAQ